MDVKPKIMDLYKIWTTTAKKAGQNLFSNVCLKANNNNNNNREREKIEG